MDVSLLNKTSLIFEGALKNNLDLFSS